MGSWLPLESSPDVLNPFIHRLGCPDDWQFCDVFGLDPELLVMVPQPCAALCLLFPSANISKVRRAELAARAGDQPPMPKTLFFCQQHDGIGNACGTLACMHAVANGALSGKFELKADGPLATFVAENTGSPSERGHALLKASALQEMSDATAAAGETEGAGTDDAQNSHFIAFVEVDGLLYECDGRFTPDGEGAIPWCHGPTTDFLTDAAKVIRDDFMARDPTSINFNIVALSKVMD